MARPKKMMHFEAAEGQVGDFNYRLSEREALTITVSLFPHTFAALLALDECQKMFPGPLDQVMEHLPGPEKAAISIMLRDVLGTILALALPVEEVRDEEE